MQIKKKYKVDLSINFGKQMYAKLKIVKTNKHKHFIMLQDMSEGEKKSSYVYVWQDKNNSYKKLI